MLTQLQSLLGRTDWRIPFENDVVIITFYVFCNLFFSWKASHHKMKVQVVLNSDIFIASEISGLIFAFQYSGKRGCSSDIVFCENPIIDERWHWALL